MRNTAHAEGKHIVTIYADGQQHTLATDADTVGDALGRAEITVGDHDAVEPALNSKLVAQTYNINVYRARPVTVVDGASRFRVMSPYQTAGKIAEDAGLQTYPEDTLTLDRIDDFVVQGGAGLRLTIQRSVPVDLFLYGTQVAARTKAKTVGEFLKFKDIKLADRDGVMPAQDTPIHADLKIAVYRDGTQTITEDHDIPFGVEQIQDADREVGFHEVREPGVNGRKKVTFEIELRDGKETSRKEIQSVVDTEPKRQLEAVGAKTAPAAMAPAAPAQSASGGGDPASNRALGHQMMLQAGFGEDQWPCLDALWTKESGWNHLADNPISDAYGIPQSLPGTKMGAGWESNPTVQIGWGLGYIRDRYGNPCGAWAHSQAVNWY